MNEPLAGLYLHVPFCSMVCPYCDFAVRTGNRDRRRRYADHLLLEIDLHRDSPLRFDTIYFGGGTPSLLDPEDLSRILVAIRRRMKIDDSCRIFLEANPEDVTGKRVSAWRRLGITTVSLGVQSLDPASLSFLGRRHSPDDACAAVELASGAGFDTVAIDLIYGLPGQGPSEWRQELERALALGAQHFSCYQLTVHDRTRFGLLERRGKLTQLPNDEQADLFLLTHRVLNDAGMQGYEVSNFASAPRHRSRHNMKYWNHTPYLGLGPSAHSFHENRRWWNLRRTDPWQQRLRDGRRPVDEEETLGTDALVLEALMLGLRTYDGVDLRSIHSRFGVDLLAGNRSLVEQLTDQGLVALVDDRLVPSLPGLAVAETLPPRFDI